MTPDEELARARAAAEGEEGRRRDGRLEADRRRKVRELLGDMARLYAIVHPTDPALESDENEATLRFVEGDDLFAATEREFARMVLPTGAPSPRSLALRLLGAYDDESGTEVHAMDPALVTVERLYAHLVSYASMEALPEALVASMARRATVILLNRRWLAEAPPRPSAEAADLCVDCGSELSDGYCRSCDA